MRASGHRCSVSGMSDLLALQIVAGTGPLHSDAKQFQQCGFLSMCDLMAAGGLHSPFSLGGLRWADSAFEDLSLFRPTGVRRVSMFVHAITHPF